MNILYVHTHDTGRYIQPYGYAVPTPNLMKLAQDGVLFRHAYCAGPTCSPSRASLLTGMAAHSTGMIGLAHLGHKLHDYKNHLAHYLRVHGYETVLCGFQHETLWTEPENLGYSRILEKEIKDYVNPDLPPLKDKSLRDYENAERAAEYIKSHDKQKPFFMSVGLLNTHRSFPEIDGEINPNYVQPPAPMFDNEQNRRDMAAYMHSAQIVDHCVGTLLQALQEARLENDTLVVFTTDHGIPFPFMKCNLNDSGIGVSLILRFPSDQYAGKAIDALASQIDLFPTLCDLVKIPKPDWVQGVSLIPLLTGETQAVRNEIFAEVNYHVEYEPMRCTRTDRYKLVLALDSLNMKEANVDGGISKNFIINNGFLDQVREAIALYDLYMDPMEKINVIHELHYASVAIDLWNRLQTWMKQTNDPLAEKAEELWSIHAATIK